MINTNEKIEAKNIYEINTNEYLANSIEYMEEKNLLFVGYNESFQIYKVEIEKENKIIKIEAKSIGIYDFDDMSDDNSNNDLLSIPSNNMKLNNGDVSSISIRALANKKETYIADLIVILNENDLENIKIIVAFNHGVVLFCEVLGFNEMNKIDN